MAHFSYLCNMKHLLIILLGLIIVTSCKKDPSKKAFLMGRLIDNCDGIPVSNQTLYFYQNFTQAANWIQQDKPEALLEEVTTNENGYFYFTGEDYTKKNTSSIYNSSIRLTDGTKLVEGILGEGKGIQDGDSYIKDVGDLLLNGMSIDLDVKLSSLNGITPYDSVVVYGLNNDGITLSTPVNNYFSTTANSVQLSKKNYWVNTDEGYGKYSLYISMYYYYNGTLNTTEGQYYYLDPCATSGSVVFDF